MEIANILNILNREFSSMISFVANPQLSNFIMLFGILVAVITIIAMWKFTERQIQEIKKVEDGKKFIGVESLIFELEQNKSWVDQFIHDCEEGGHKGKKDKDFLSYTWVWNPPQLIAYQNYLTVACSGDKELATKIINLYLRLTSCQIIVHFIHQLFINNENEKIIKYNESLENICFEIKDWFKEPIEKLKSIAESFYNKLSQKVESSASGYFRYGTAINDPVFVPQTPTGSTISFQEKTGEEEQKGEGELGTISESK